MGASYYFLKLCIYLIMQVRVIKVGGLLLSKDNYWNDIIKYLKSIRMKYQIVLVCSAIGRNNDPYSTDGLNKSVDGYLTLVERNQLKAIGETYSVLKVSGDLRRNGFAVKSLMWNQIGLTINGSSFKFNPKPLKEHLKEEKLLVVPGFLGSDGEGNVTTFKREGSDYSAVIFAHYLGLDSCYLVKDVGGVYDYAHNVYHELTYENFYKIVDNFTSPIAIDAVRFCEKNNMKLFIINSTGFVSCKISKKLVF